MSEQFPDLKYEDVALLAILDALEADLGTVRAFKKLGVNSRTFASCRDSRTVRPTIRRALKACVGWGPVVDHPILEDQPEDQPEDIGQSHTQPEGPDEGMAQAVAALKAENSQLQATVDTQTAHIADWERRLAFLAQTQHKGGRRGWLSRNRPAKGEETVTGSFMDPPIPEVVTLEHRLGEEQVLGRAAPLVSEWRNVNWRAITSEDPVELTSARFRKLELEIELIVDFHLTLPPYTEPLDLEARGKESHARRCDLFGAGEKLRKAEPKQS